MKVYKKTKKTITKEVLIKVVCDVCKKEVGDGSYYDITTGHYEWGDDSGDSIEIKQACSDECLQVEFNNYLKSEYESKYIEIERI